MIKLILFFNKIYSSIISDRSFVPITFVVLDLIVIFVPLCIWVIASSVLSVHLCLSLPLILITASDILCITLGSEVRVSYVSVWVMIFVHCRRFHTIVFRASPFTSHQYSFLLSFKRHPFDFSSLDFLEFCFIYIYMTSPALTLVYGLKPISYLIQRSD